MIHLSLQADPAVRITARTQSEENASSRALRKNGFEQPGVVRDEENGEVWEWEFKKIDP
ncbi:MAG: hypothetical protein IPJ82_01570 [Lewinellaceae bacterium]|nr:hypothetical protein [Lewinellaceae bacterium]